MGNGARIEQGREAQKAANLTPVSLDAPEPARGKGKQNAVTAVARELLGCIWAIGIEVERNQQPKEQRRAA
jgi:hypothetical protein